MEATFLRPSSAPGGHTEPLRRLVGRAPSRELGPPADSLDAALELETVGRGEDEVGDHSMDTTWVHVPPDPGRRLGARAAGPPYD